jgi:Spy/CpxP family protein refolding chaperone
MRIRYFNVVMAVLLTISLIIPSVASAGNLPETPINKVLNYQTGLELTDVQIKNLGLINNNIVNKMLQIQAQAQRCKSQIDQYLNDWSSLDNPKAKSAVKEYYQCQADLKTLELEAMAQASQVLTEQQIKKFGELITIEINMIDSRRSNAIIN